MLPSRRLRRWTAGCVALVILFAQVAVAAYACPITRAAVASEARMPCGAPMPGTAAFDQAQPGLCQQHCQFGSAQLGADPGHSPAPPAMAPMPWPVLRLAATTARDSAWLQHARDRARVPLPPHCLLHCCLLI
jgi:hypothetical protein